jgi:CRISPR/Cas system-associated endonuclease Cas3-HD
MILGKDTNPSKHIYFLGAKVLDILKNDLQKEINILDTFQKLNTEEKVSMNLFTLTLDWLYILGSVKKNKNGKLEKCF